MTFAEMKLSACLVETLASEGYDVPTPIQAQAIPPLLEGHDLLGCAQTGTGKTAAFSLPLIERLLSGPGRRSKGKESPRARALVLAPTRELAVQIDQSMRTYGRGTKLRAAVIYGGVRQSLQVRALRAGVDVIVATPGRLLDLMEQGHVDLSGVGMFVLDEADRMLDMGFIDPIRRIGRALPEDRQTVLFSATMPANIRSLADSMLTTPVTVAVKPEKQTTALIDQSIYHVDSTHKTVLLTYLLAADSVTRSVVFTRTKHAADKLAKVLNREGITSVAIHGNRTQAQRERALDSFRSGRAGVLVATDVAARGLDVDGVSHVFNYNLPNEPEAYVHRIGRTGRAGANGHAVSLCSRDERGFLKAIERLIDRKIEITRPPEELQLPKMEPPAADSRSKRGGGGGGGGGRKPSHGKPFGGKSEGGKPAARKPRKKRVPAGAKRGGDGGDRQAVGAGTAPGSGVRGKRTANKPAGGGRPGPKRSAKAKPARG